MAKREGRDAPGADMTVLMSLHRRAQAERQAIRLLRGGQVLELHRSPSRYRSSGRPTWLQPTPEQLRSFRELREIAMQNGLKIQPLSTLHISFDELDLLRCLACRQRLDLGQQFTHFDAALIAAVDRFALALDAMGIHLPALSLLARPQQ